MPVLPKIGLTTKVSSKFSNFEWYGRGPYENYPDRKIGSLIDRYQHNIDELYFPYIRPQENGNRTDVRWLSFSDSDGTGVIVFGDQNFNFSAQRFSLENLTNAKHTNELRQDNSININIDHKMMGLGGDDSWNPRTHDEYLIHPGKYNYSYLFRFCDDVNKGLNDPIFYD